MVKMQFSYYQVGHFRSLQGGSINTSIIYSFFLTQDITLVTPGAAAAETLSVKLD
jgi:hypothetical protein